MTALPPRQPSRCGRCGSDWYDTHACPSLGNSTALPRGYWASNIPSDPLAELRAVKAEIDRLRAALVEIRHKWPDAPAGEIAAKALQHDGTIASVPRTL